CASSPEYTPLPQHSRASNSHRCISTSIRFFLCFFFFFNDPATTEIYTLSLHDALPIFAEAAGMPYVNHRWLGGLLTNFQTISLRDRKSTRLNSSHVSISYAVFCLKKKKTFCSLYNHMCDILSQSMFSTISGLVGEV